MYHPLYVLVKNLSFKPYYSADFEAPEGLPVCIDESLGDFQYFGYFCDGQNVHDNLFVVRPWVKGRIENGSPFRREISLLPC